jgi:hypothetical protein
MCLIVSGGVSPWVFIIASRFKRLALLIAQDEALTKGGNYCRTARNSHNTMHKDSTPLFQCKLDKSTCIRQVTQEVFVFCVFESDGEKFWARRSAFKTNG